jgi:hypothetical protein
MIKKLLLFVLCIGSAFLLLAMKGIGSSTGKRVLVAKKAELYSSPKTKTIQTLSPTGGEIACALLSCPAVLSITE